MKKVLLTGLTGFIGLHLAKKLLKDGWEVHAIVRPTSDIKKVNKVLGDQIYIHVHTKKDTLMDIVHNVHPNIVFHLASLYLPKHAYNDIPALIDSNITFGTQLLDAMVENGIYYFINTGTSWQHYKNEKYNPVNLYAASKQAFLAMQKYYEETTPLKVINLQLFDTYGPGDSRRKLFTLLKEASESGETLLMSPGDQLIDIVYIDDVVDAFLCAAKLLLSNNKKSLSNTYAVSSGNPLKLRDLVQKFEDVSGRHISVKWGGRPYRIREVMRPWSIGNKIPGWHCKVTLEKGVKSYLKENE
ncbi:NAD-dependent epimerase/dehydratase family protein [Mitsuokella multacida]|uniref:NAD-dependent epimerase/dehydratase family protein n=1 Tax=Mitsuokella multacida TaxID=52226 RepID=UPI001F443283|nr:NAD-dependent epimerase/dehydratase family protein [Mitsuokella multacida]MCF2584140.1 NAD-dependent epimerase/dehydratase family protein [Mitsuokella multacida]